MLMVFVFMFMLCAWVARVQPQGLRALLPVWAGEQPQGLRLHALRQIVRDGFFEGLLRFKNLGSWANANGWQIFLWLGTISNNPRKFIAIYDRFFLPITRNFVGDLIVSFIITVWFFSKLVTSWIRFKSRKC